jgi:hypothetical protein
MVRIVMIYSCELAGQILVTPLVMYIESTNPSYGPIAIRVTIDPESETMGWGDTGRGRSIRFQEYTIDEEKIVAVAKDGHKWIFVPLTLEIFNRIKKQLVSIGKEFETDEELQAFYANMNFYG